MTTSQLQACLQMPATEQMSGRFTNLNFEHSCFPPLAFTEGLHIFVNEGLNI